MKRLLITVFTLLAITSYSQSPEIEWAKCYGGDAQDFGKDIIQTIDGGYIIAGSVDHPFYILDVTDFPNYHGEEDYGILKISNLGTIEWTNCYGGNRQDVAKSIRQTYDSGYIITGSASSYDGDVIFNHGLDGYSSDCWVLKLTKSGNIQWQKSLGGSYFDEATCIRQTTDSGFIVAGYTLSPNDGDISGRKNGWDYLVFKLNKKGEIEWQKCLGGNYDDFCYSVEETYDGGFILAGSSKSSDGDVTGHHGYYNDDCWIVKLTDNGQIEWQKCLGGDYYDVARSIKPTADGGYIMIGSTSSVDGDVTLNKGEVDCWVVKLDNSGNILWQKTFGGSGQGDDGYEIFQTKDGGYVTACSAGSIDGDVIGKKGWLDFWVIRLDSTGNIEWAKTMGGTSIEEAYSIKQTNDDGFIVAGYTLSNDFDIAYNRGSYDYWIVKLKPETTLPLSFLSFTATIQQNKALLKWSTANEINNDYFTIERSSNNKDFAAVGTVHSQQATGNGQKDYSFTDNNPLIGKSYYRIKQTDKDGSFSYSKIIPVNNVVIASMMIKPNPSDNGIFNIDLGTVRNNISIVITDNSGRKIYTTQNASAQNLIVDLGDKPKGIYYLQISYDGGNEKQRLVIE